MVMRRVTIAAGLLLAAAAIGGCGAMRGKMDEVVPEPPDSGKIAPTKCDEATACGNCVSSRPWENGKEIHCMWVPSAKPECVMVDPAAPVVGAALHMNQCNALSAARRP
jgi:hypothetical protein